ncbi:hypothetical protein [Streptomyces noursei]|uniref:hypothetical protein n=1 Tax=Streptomyces noursei TaxID=1971 RepID=UPI00045EFC4B|nr:hypothetical protein [Streptomyces noursei]AIA03454.1 hypothetical protein DC74_2954 [Streptomyces noursei]
MNTTPTNASLIVLAARGQLPLHQYMDRATIDWITANRPDLQPCPQPALRPIAQNLLRRAGLPHEWLAEPLLYDSIHGIRHGMRTAALAAILAEATELDDADTATAIVAAAVHDCQRHHDKDDRGHGARAAIWLAANADTVWDRFGLTAAPRRVMQAATAVRLHDVPYGAFSPDDQADYLRNKTICDLVKAADALDRYRLPKTRWWPSTQHVREPAFDGFRSLAFDLVDISENAHLVGVDSAAAVLYALSEKALV